MPVGYHFTMSPFECLARRRLDGERLRPSARQHELPHPAPHRQWPARRSRSALCQPATRRTQPIRTSALCGRACLVHGALRTHADNDASLHRVLPRNARPLRADALYSAAVLRCLRSVPLDAAQKGRRERKGWRDWDRRAPEIGWVPDREPDIHTRDGKEVETAWMQERENQLALLDTFFGALRSEESLCFFYAKRTPLSEQSLPCNYLAVHLRGNGDDILCGLMKEPVPEFGNPV